MNVVHIGHVIYLQLCFKTTFHAIGKNKQPTTTLFILVNTNTKRSTCAMFLQCSSDIPKPKYTHNSHQPKNVYTRIWIMIFAHMHIWYTHICLISTVCVSQRIVSSFHNWSLLFQWLDSLTQSTRPRISW